MKAQFALAALALGLFASSAAQAHSDQWYWCVANPVQCTNGNNPYHPSQPTPPPPPRPEPGFGGPRPGGPGPGPGFGGGHRR